ncbi:hypothetical protein [Peribacillus frigoritolerans]|uniref:hypothetical protein n=1 Tax=Peribacillus frigoritolerans TaxID=450367 RepID=UPI0020C0C05C|nr:hypothetical protein [Peribacillus frigoritolerans]
MDKFLIEILMSEIKNQCEMVKIAVEGINSYQNETKESAQLWFNVQGLLIATSNISKILWSYEREEPKEVTYLKSLLEIDDSSKVKSRFFRNLFEHYDRHLIEWGKNRKTNSFATSNTFPKGMNLGIPTENIFKTYYNDVNAIAFQNKEYELQPVIREVARIYDKILATEEVLRTSEV